MKKDIKITKVPKFLQSALWSYDISKMDPKNKHDKRVIIEQVLNFGTWEQTQWVVKNYSWREIKEVVKNPSRGMWNKKSLNYWTRFFGISLPNQKYKISIMQIDPALR